MPYVTRAIVCGALLFAAGSVLLPGLAHAQAQAEKPLVDAPLYPDTTDVNGVNVLNGIVTFGHSIRLGPEGGGVSYSLVYDSSSAADGNSLGWRDSTTGSIGCYVDTGEPGMYQKRWATVDGDTEVVDSGYSERIATDEPLPSSRADAPGGGSISENDNYQYLIYIKRGGSRVEFESGEYDPVSGCDFSHQVKKITRASGETLTYHYGSTYPVTRITIASSLGYQVRIASVPYGPIATDRECVRFAGFQFDGYPRCVSSVTLVDTSIDNCSPTAECVYSRQWPTLTINYTGPNTMQVVDSLNRTTTYTSAMHRGSQAWEAKMINRVQSPGGRDRAIAYLYRGGATTSNWVRGQVASITDGPATWTYAYAPTNDSGPNIFGYFTGAISVTDPTNRTTVYTSSARRLTGYGNPTPYLSSVTDSAGETTSYTWFGYHRHRPKSISYPSGYRIDHAYDARHNLTGVTRTPAGGGAPIQVQIGYQSTCANIFTCNQPNYRIDERGARTDFTYDVGHGALTSVMGPAPGSGPYASVRPLTSYEYDTGAAGVVRLIRTRTCATAQTCTGTANESVVETLYDAKRRPVRVASRAGDWAVTTATTADARSSVATTTYSPLGDIATVDGPLAGDGDTIRSYYDNGRQLTSTVSPDPDGAGVVTRMVERFVYDGDGRVIRAETGTATAADGSDFSLSRFRRSTYDLSSGLLTKVEEVLP